MNWSLFSSKIHFCVSALVAVVFAGWLSCAGAAPGAREGSDRLFLLTSGWGAFTVMLICFLYVPRKYFHRVASQFRASFGGSNLGSARSQRLRERQIAIEQAEAELEAVRFDIRMKRCATRAEALDRARAILLRYGISRLVRPVVPAGEGGLPAGIRLAPLEPMGRMASWLHSHFYYGMLFALLVFLHGGLSVGSFLGAAMLILSIVVVVTGIIGIGLLARGPVWLTPRSPELGLEQSHALCIHLEQRIEELSRELRQSGMGMAQSNSIPSGRLAAPQAAPSLAVAEPAILLRDLNVLRAQQRRFQASLRRLKRVSRLMNAWRLVHVPASILLVGVVVLHVLCVWWY